MTPRATPLSADERRQGLIDAVVPLLREHGRGVTTKQIAQAAGVAEGTIFRVFDSKEDLVDAALQAAFEPGDFIDAVRAIDPDLPLEPRLIALVTVVQRRYQDVFGLMRAVGLTAPPEHLTRQHDRSAHLAQALEAMADVVRPDESALRVPVEQVVHLLRLLTFSGSHREIAAGHPLTPAQIVDVVLHGTAHRKDS